MVYWDSNTEAAVIRFKHASTQEEKDEIFEKELFFPLYKLVENIINSYFLHVPGEKIEDVIYDCISFIYQKIDYFDESRGDFIVSSSVFSESKNLYLKSKYKSYSYFGTIIKRYLISRRKEKQVPYRVDIDSFGDYCDDYKHLDDVTNKKISENKDFLIYQPDCFAGEFSKYLAKYFERHKKSLCANSDEEKMLDIMINFLHNPDHLTFGTKKEFYNIIRNVVDIKNNNAINIFIKKIRKVYQQVKDKYYNGKE